MITAAARTNAIGHIVGGQGDLDSFSCETSQFVIETARKGSAMFVDMGELTRDEEFKNEKLGDILGCDDDRLHRIAKHLSENGVSLYSPIYVYHYVSEGKKEVEVHVRTERFRLLYGRVYGQGMSGSRS